MNRTIGLISANYTFSGYDTLTDERPVASMPFGGRFRLLDFPLSNMVNSRIQTVGLITPYFYRSIMDHEARARSGTWTASRAGSTSSPVPPTASGIPTPASSSGTSSGTRPTSAGETGTIFSSPRARWWPTSTMSP